MLPSRQIGCLNGINTSLNQKGRCIKNAPALFQFEDHTLLEPDLAPLFLHPLQICDPVFNVIFVLKLIVQDLHRHLVRGEVLPGREVCDLLVPFDGTSFSCQVLLQNPFNVWIGRFLVKIGRAHV